MTDVPRQYTFTPEEPIKVGDKTYTELTFRRLKGKDMVKMDLVKGATLKTFAMMASMSSVPILVFEEMDGDDVDDDSDRKGNGQPTVELPNPLGPVHCGRARSGSAHGCLASRSTSFSPIIFQP